MSTRLFPHVEVHVHFTHEHDVTQVLLAAPMAYVLTLFATEAAPCHKVFVVIPFGQNAIWLLIFPLSPLMIIEPRWQCHWDWLRTTDSFHRIHGSQRQSGFRKRGSGHKP
jgi:hypothetical protein